MTKPHGYKTVIFDRFFFKTFYIFLVTLATLRDAVLLLGTILLIATAI